jgi:carbamoyl-phosphate synthase (ammonia)
VGADTSSAGEVVFTTGMVGYPESLTDPSFTGQFINMTYPMIGNYGVPGSTDMARLDEHGLTERMESDRIHAAGMIMQDYSCHSSHWESERTLSQWLKAEGIPAISGVDTRAITKKLRGEGSMLGKIEVEGGGAVEFYDPNVENLVAKVCSLESGEERIFGAGNPVNILALDCGIKYSIIRRLVEKGACVKLVPWDHDILSEHGWYHGLFLSNGPGDPEKCAVTVDHLRKVLALEGEDIRPIFGICLGNQLLGTAAGASTFKLPFGNRGQNQPVVNQLNQACYITPQNHGFALEGSQLPANWIELFVNGNDFTNEGIMHTSLPFFTAQFHPEASNGPNDTDFLFDTFLQHASELKELKESGESIAPSLRRIGVPANGTDYVVPPLKKVLVLGSGGLSIGQAGEFDYSGSQAIKALKEDGLEVVLINPNIASVQTNVASGSIAQADNVYYIPVTKDFVTEVIKREKPDGIVISMGGQTALNVGIELDEAGVFAEHDVHVVGTSIETIIATEDRELFSRKMHEINEKIADSYTAVNVAEAQRAAAKLGGFPVMIRSAFALGGLGSGICHSEEHLAEMAAKAFAGSPQILVEKSMLGWKEVEYEVVRDGMDNCITVCNMENFDPLGVHTGDSIVVAPSQTLSDREYHMLRKTAINVVRHLGIIGECNIQYALHPESLEYCIIEVNPRLSRSSALASKATGYPLAAIAAQLGLGKSLPELRNAVTKSTTACFEPSLDYVVAKVPRWDLAKFSQVSTDIGSAMKAIGEVMAIGRTFEEVIQKALRMVSDGGVKGFELNDANTWTRAELEHKLVQPSDVRIWAIAQALSGEMTVDEVHELTKIDTWYLDRLQGILDCGENIEGSGSLAAFSAEKMLEAKQLGFADIQLARRLGCTEAEVRAQRKGDGIVPVVKQVDTLAAEFPASTNYLYTTYHGTEDDVPINDTKGGVMVLGSGAYRIGSSVEFDWCSVSAIRTLRELGRKTVVINFNPETVSTDYDEVDQLYFEELSLERVLDIYEREGVQGVIVSCGGQIPNNLALPLHEAGVNVLGTSPVMIDSAEDRAKFSDIMDAAGVKQPEWKELKKLEDALTFAKESGYPTLVRPSYVLSGAAMNVAYDEEELIHFLKLAGDVSGDHPVVLTKYIEDAVEIDFDGVARGGEIVACALSEHVENAGVHSGDATLVLPPKSTSDFTVHKCRLVAEKVAKALNVTGPFNMQLIAKGADVSVIECNLRASRSFPFVSKTTGSDFIAAATKVMIDADISNDNLPDLDSLGKRPANFVGIKAPMFSYKRLPGADPVLGVEMASTGEVACFGRDIHEAFLKSLISTGNFDLPKKNILLSVQERFREKMVHAAYQLHDTGYSLFCTKETHEFLTSHNVPCTRVDFPMDGEDTEFANCETMIKEGAIDLVINLPNQHSMQGENNYRIRRTAMDFSVPLLTNIMLAQLFAESMAIHKDDPMIGLKSDSLFDYYNSEKPEDTWTGENEFH